MGAFDRLEAARRADVEPVYLDRLFELGVVIPDGDGLFTAGSVRRAQMARTLEGAGIPLEGLGDAIRGGRLSMAFLDSPSFDRFAAHADETFRQLAERTGLPLDLLMVIREAVGSAPPGPDDMVREDELRIVPLVAAQLGMGMRPISVQRELRVFGESLRRMAETESDTWRREVMEPLLAGGASPAQMDTQVTGEESERHDRAMADAVLALFRAQEARAWTGNIIAGFEHMLASAGLYTRLDRPPAMCFLDMTGYTRLTRERGDEAAASLAERLGRLVNRTTLQRGGRPVKWLGDGVMLYFRDPGPGVQAAVEMLEGVKEEGLPPAHVGLHAGPVLFQEGDYFGQTVNIASRIAEYARPGEILVSQEVVDAAQHSGAAFTEIGPVELKGVGAPLRLFSVQTA
jgi:class 3 adenylate cyclase